MVWETVRKPFDVEKMIKEMNLLWDCIFFKRVLRSTSKSIHIVETKEVVVKKSGVSKAIKVE